MSGEAMYFPDTVEEFMEQYKIVDSKQVYTNGVELVPIFRMKQWFEQHPEPHWIPVTERLPEYGNPVLTWDGQCYLVEKRIPYITDDDGERIYADWWVSDDYDEENSEYYPNLRDGACIAWCELPEPYEGVTE